MRRLLCAAIVSVVATGAAAEESILQLYDHFTIAQIVGERCAEPTLAEATAFTDKFRELGELAALEAQRLNPALAPGEFDEFAARHRHQLQSGVVRFLDDHGCGHADAVALAVKYKEFQTLELAY